MATHLEQPPLDFQRIREDLESTIKEKVSTEVEIAWPNTLCHFGSEASRVSAIIEFSRKHPPNPDPFPYEEDEVRTEEDSEFFERIGELARQARVELQVDAIAQPFLFTEFAFISCGMPAHVMCARKAALIATP